MRQKETIKRVLGLTRPYQKEMAGMLLLALVTVASTLYVPIVIGQGIDLIIGKNQVLFAGLTRVLLQLLVVIGVTALAQWIMNRLTNRITFHIVKDIRMQAFHRLEDLPISYLDGHPGGDVVSRIATDADQLGEGLFMGFAQLFTGVLTILGTLLFMISISWKITLIVVVLTPVSFVVSGTVARRTFAMFRKQSEARGELTSLVEELVGNQRVVQAFAYEERAERRFAKVNQKLAKYSVRAIFFSSISNPATRFINGLIYTGVGIFGAFSAIAGSITVGQLSAFLNYANQYTKPFNEISGVVTELQNAFASAGRLFELIDEPVELADAADAVVLEKTKGQVELRNVSFSYDPERSLIQELNICAKPGQKVAIVGATGCGKTTVINLLMRFYEVNGGSICIDGQDIRRVTRDSLRSVFGMVLQDTWLKVGTIHDNIAYGKPDATREEIVQAARKAQADGFIRRMKDGYDTYLPEDGGNLSQGQRQLLCIARVMLMDPAMLILDEATSSIDTMTEARVQKAFDLLMEGRTSFVVAHRLSTIQHADTILVMQDGRIIERGNHRELLKKGGSYAQLYKSQFTNA